MTRERRLYDTSSVAPADAKLGPGCRCRRPLVDGTDGDCSLCGRPARLITAWARELRYLSYTGALEAAAGLGLDRATGFRGLSPELGPNPELAALHTTLQHRLAALGLDVDEPPARGDAAVDGLEGVEAADGWGLAA